MNYWDITLVSLLGKFYSAVLERMLGLICKKLLQGRRCIFCLGHGTGSSPKKLLWGSLLRVSGELTCLVDFETVFDYSLSCFTLKLLYLNNKQWFLFQSSNRNHNVFLNEVSAHSTCQSKNASMNSDKVISCINMFNHCNKKLIKMTVCLMKSYKVDSLINITLAVVLLFC